MNRALSEGQYFFSDIKKEGCLLYDSRNFKLARKRKLSSKEQKEIAKEHYEHWFGRSQSFYNGYIDAMKRNDYKKAAFELHQTAESCYKTILLVFENYNPNEHYLGLLGDMAAKYDSTLDSIFPRKTKKERDFFKKLDHAYIGARYDPKYKISQEALAYLSGRVKKLLEKTRGNCAARFE